MSSVLAASASLFTVLYILRLAYYWCSTKENTNSMGRRGCWFISILLRTSTTIRFDLPKKMLNYLFLLHVVHTFQLCDLDRNIFTFGSQCIIIQSLVHFKTAILSMINQREHKFHETLGLLIYKHFVLNFYNLFKCFWVIQYWRSVHK